MQSNVGRNPCGFDMADVDICRSQGYPTPWGGMSPSLDIMLRSVIPALSNVGRNPCGFDKEERCQKHRAFDLLMDSCFRRNDKVADIPAISALGIISTWT